MTSGEISIAITVFDRRDYIREATAHALEQTMPVRVMVVEDCGPDPAMQSFLSSCFGERIVYYRNARRRGLFGNWNACLELCGTPWLCICHDDDFLEPTFVEAMVELSEKIPGRGLYYGACNLVGANGEVLKATHRQKTAQYWDMDLIRAALKNPIAFPGELFRADYARALGGFCPNSLFAGDWDMWMQLAAVYGAAGTTGVVGNSRTHAGPGRGTTRVERSGKRLGLMNMQSKKNLALLRRRGIRANFDRDRAASLSPMPMRYLLENAAGLSPRILAYNCGLLLRSPSPHVFHFVLKILTRIFGPACVRAASRLWAHAGSGALRT